MAINQHPRENLLAEATAYCRRVLIRLSTPSPLQNVDVFIGIRSGGGWSIYLGQDPVYHFTTGNCLRRAFVANQRYASQTGQLWRLGRDKLGGKVQLERQQLERVVEHQLLADCQRLLHEVLQAIDSGQFELLGSVSSQDISSQDISSQDISTQDISTQDISSREASLLSETRRLLLATSCGIQLADSPNT